MKKIIFFSIISLVFFLIPALGEAAILSLEPATGSYEVGQIFKIDVKLDTQGIETAGVDIHWLNYDPSLLELQDADLTTSGLQVEAGQLYANTNTNLADFSTGKINFSQTSAGGTTFNGIGVLAALTFKALDQGEANLTFDFILNSTTDTNVASNGQDVLTSVINGSYTLTLPPPPDTTPPLRSNGQPTGTLSSGTTQTNISLDTNENATCKYSTIAEIDYDSMTDTFSTTGEISHSTLVTGLNNGNTYNYYIRCLDNVGNKNTDDFIITFSIASSPGGGGGGGGLPPPQDTTPPANVSDFEAEPGDSLITLSWENPVDPDFSKVKIMRSTEDYPLNPDEETKIYDDKGTLFEDTDVLNGIKYYYVAFSYDNSGNYASGAQASAIPSGELLPAPPEKPITEMTIEELQARIAEILALIAAVKAQIAQLLGIPGIPAGFTFEKNLSYDMIDPEVVYLKIVFAGEGCVTGLANTQWFGPKTLAGTKCFCEKYRAGISEAAGYEVACTGFIGTGNRAKLNELLGR